MFDYIIIILGGSTLKKSMPGCDLCSSVADFFDNCGGTGSSYSESIQSISDFSSGSRIPDGNLAAGEESAAD